MSDVSDKSKNDKAGNFKIGLYLGAASLLLSCVMLFNIGDRVLSLASSKIVIEQYGSAIILGMTCVYTSFSLITLTSDQIFEKKTSRFVQFLGYLMAGSLMLYLSWVGFNFVITVKG
jgi:hypothetical protein